ncbi:uncharacterized protein HMPREF1120_03908 [Exophiala dermatitidis NIH/UT8656]|uniref:Uncharacterized protein n=1 Tax=Exophiala dermatitidis (strain ATCC 34100 / CBS 525.76 / NIH/UT8656) TaxID=858893 RepID=H6BUU7_EXODN|nr:uncharacterized protein HMPREF1120_03908 [Exophiala dermatitidis NIH/UT8656]EHY55784.1 hypothetical protein HMPREF1120_03908 [Exophiala dermatitidis NIH/UT8656]
MVESAAAELTIQLSRRPPPHGSGKARLRKSTLPGFSGETGRPTTRRHTRLQCQCWGIQFPPSLAFKAPFSPTLDPVSTCFFRLLCVVAVFVTALNSYFRPLSTPCSTTYLICSEHCYLGT